MEEEEVETTETEETESEETEETETPSGFDGSDVVSSYWKLDEPAPPEPDEDGKISKEAFDEWKRASEAHKTSAKFVRSASDIFKRGIYSSGGADVVLTEDDAKSFGEFANNLFANPDADLVVKAFLYDKAVAASKGSAKPKATPPKVVNKKSGKGSKGSDQKEPSPKTGRRGLTIRQMFESGMYSDE